MKDKVMINITDEEITSLCYAKGTMKYHVKHEKNEVWKNDMLKVIADIESIVNKYREAEFKDR